MWGKLTSHKHVLGLTLASWTLMDASADLDCLDQLVATAHPTLDVTYSQQWHNYIRINCVLGMDY